MALALSLGQRGMGRVWPNPAVGCVIVRDGTVVGRGRTADGGRPHAETEALAKAGNAAKGATVYVTLEPCSHHGHTPPCAAALIAAGVARVVVATGDPDPRVAGAGVAMLRDAGITVDLGVLEGRANRDHAGFFLNRNQGRPWVTLKLATTLDGRIATAGGDSQWITGPLARRLVHAMRARHDAVMVGGGTVRADDPSLTVRDLGPVPQPVRIVLSQTLDLPADCTLARSAGQVPVWVCHAKDAKTLWPGAQSVVCRVRDGQLDLASVLAELAKKGLTRVFCEGGGQVAASLLQADLVDELVLFQGGAIIGAEGRPAMGPLGVDRLADAPRLELVQHRAVGPDMMQRWRRA